MGDNYRDKIYEYERDEYCNSKNEYENNLKRKFENMSLEEKVNYLINNHIEAKISEIRL